MTPVVIGYVEAPGLTALTRSYSITIFVFSDQQRAKRDYHELRAIARRNDTLATRSANLVVFVEPRRQTPNDNVKPPATLPPSIARALRTLANN
jgi:hypothetical protein